MESGVWKRRAHESRVTRGRVRIVPTPSKSFSTEAIARSWIDGGPGTLSYTSVPPAARAAGCGV